jgi:DNA-directed RNA polymerase subunit M/transcription elongation factor TFIIS
MKEFTCKQCAKTFPVPKRKDRGFAPRTYCDSCWYSLYGPNAKNFSKTKEELFKNKSTWQSARSSIQRSARRVYQYSDKPKHCTKCGYDKHYEVAHIKSVADFPSTALVSTINSIDNLIALCPNCHWEHDNL